MARRFGLVLGLAAGLVAACLALVVISGTLELAVALAVAVIALVVPGFLVSRAIAPFGWGDQVMELVAAIALGFATAALGGILLNFLGIRLTPQAWIALLVLAALLGGAVSYVRGGRIGAASRGAATAVRETAGRGIRDHAASGGRDWRLKPIELTLLVVALVLAAASIRIARVGLADQPQPGFTQLWILPAASAGHVDVGVANSEGSPETYRLDVIRGTRQLSQWRAVEVANGATWSVTVSLPAGGSGPVEARLYRSTDPTHVYRSVSYWPPS